MARYHKIMITTASVVEQLVAPLVQQIKLISAKEENINQRISQLTGDVANAEPPAIKKLSAKNEELKKLLNSLRKGIRGQRAELKYFLHSPLHAERKREIEVLENFLAEKSQEQKDTSSSLRKEKDSATDVAYLVLVKQLKDATKQRQALRKQLKVLCATTTPSEEDIVAITQDHFGNPVDAAAVLSRELLRCWNDTPAKLAYKMLDAEANDRGAFWQWRRFVLKMADRASWTKKERGWIAKMDESSFLRYPPGSIPIYASIVFLEQSAGSVETYTNNPLRRHFRFADLEYWVAQHRKPGIKANSRWMVPLPADFIRSQASKDVLQRYILEWEKCQGDVLDGFLGLYDLVRSHDATRALGSIEKGRPMQHSTRIARPSFASSHPKRSSSRCFGFKTTRPSESRSPTLNSPSRPTQST